MVQSDQYLGMLTAEELVALYPKRRFVTSAAQKAATQAWAAFTSATPEALVSLAAREQSGLPFLRAALHRLCEEYPAEDTGLSRTQKQLVETCAAGAHRSEDLFRRSQMCEEAPFLGDVACFAAIDDLSAQPAALLAASERGYELTVLGRRVLAGDADWLEHQPLDRWIGGVHLTSRQQWRWDEVRQTLVKREPAVQG